WTIAPDYSSQRAQFKGLSGSKEWGRGGLVTSLFTCLFTGPRLQTNSRQSASFPIRQRGVRSMPTFRYAILLTACVLMTSCSPVAWWKSLNSKAKELATLEARHQAL